MGEGLLDGSAVRRMGRAFGRPQPVVAYLPLLVWVSDSAGFQVGHRGERLREARLQLAKDGVVEIRQAQINRKIEFAKGVIAGLKVRPVHGFAGLSESLGSR